MAVSYVMCICFLFIVGIGLSAACPEGLEQHGDRCYKLFHLLASWAEAKVYCTVIGGDLVKIDDANENAIVAGLVQRSHGSTQDVRFWIDGSDILAENEWRWMGQMGASKRMTFTNWIPGQPDHTNDIEDCLELANSFQGQWNDVSCETRREGFICEANVQQGNQEVVG